MMKYTAGAICGWVAARSLSDKPIVPPSTDELAILAKKASVFVATFSEKMKDYQIRDKKNEK